MKKEKSFNYLGGVGQPQQGLSGPAHGFILGLPSPHPQDGGIPVLSEQGKSRATHCGPAVAPQTRHETPTHSPSHTRVQGQVRCLNTQSSPSYTPVPKLSARLGQCAADKGLALQLGDLRAFGCSSFMGHTLQLIKRK